MGKPSNRQTTIIQPDKPTLVQYSQSLTPQRNYAAEFDAVFNYTPSPAQEQTNPILRDIESMQTRQNERQVARKAYLPYNIPICELVIINAAKQFRISIPKSRCLVILQLSICMQDSFITLYLFIFYFAQVPKAIYLTGL